VHLNSLSDLQIQAVWVRITGNTGSVSYPSGEDAYGVDANISVMEGLRVGGDYAGNHIGNFGSTGFSQPAGATSILYHVDGSGRCTLNLTTTRCKNGGCATRTGV